MMMIAIILTFLFCLIRCLAYPETNSVGYPICSHNYYYSNGQLNIDDTLYNCSSNIAGARLIPSYVPYPNGDFSPVNVSLSVKVNNLITVSDITSEVRMDFFVNLVWADSRWYLPDLFGALNPQIAEEGLDVTLYVRSQTPLNIWLPDITIYEASEMNILSENIKIYPDGTVSWAYILVVALQEPQNRIFAYPMDSQNYSLTFQSFSFDSSFLNIVLLPNSVTFRNNEEYNRDSVNLNQLWFFRDFSFFTKNVPLPATYNSKRQFSSAFVNLRFQRQSFGVIIRMALPVAMFMLIVGFSFWADIEKRLDVAIQMLLIVTALYLIIGSTIPFVGYLTTMDKYMSCVFVLLSLTIGVHVVCLRLENSSDKHPMASFYQKCIVLFFKIVWIPCTIAVFIFFFLVNVPVLNVAFYSSIIACSSQVLFYASTMRESFKTSLIKLRKIEEQINSQLLKKISGKMTGHEAHLIRRLTTSEKVVLYLTRSIYKTVDQIHIESFNKHKKERESFEKRFQSRSTDLTAPSSSNDFTKNDGYSTIGAFIHGGRIGAPPIRASYSQDTFGLDAAEEHRSVGFREEKDASVDRNVKASPTAASTNGSSNGQSYKGRYGAAKLSNGNSNENFEIMIGGEQY